MKKRRSNTRLLCHNTIYEHNTPVTNHIPRRTAETVSAHNRRETIAQGLHKMLHFKINVCLRVVSFQIPLRKESSMPAAQYVMGYGRGR
jgi:hypothetical protein